MIIYLILVTMNFMFGSKQTIWFIELIMIALKLAVGDVRQGLDAGHNCFASIVTKSGYTNEKGDLIRSMMSPEKKVSRTYNIRLRSKKYYSS